jgi:predicted secreted hydrolase
MSSSSPVLSRRLRGATIAAVAVAVLAVVVPRASSAAGHADSATAAADPSFPTFVHLPADQAAHPSSPIEWWYTAGHLYSRGHEYGYEAQLTAYGLTQLAITDVTTGQYFSQQTAYAPGQFTVSSTDLNVHMPDAALSGPMNAMHLTATLPQGSFDLTLSAAGPALYGNGTGLFPFLGGSSYYYSLPNLRTTGTLTVDGRTSKVTGQSWLDRQWGAWDFTRLQHWTWMSIQLGNGEYLNLWDLFDTGGEHSWATVLHRDGSESVVAVEPLAQGATGFATSPATGQRYAGAWTVRIPDLKTRLTVTASPVLQEIQTYSPVSPGIDEATSAVTGTYQGGHVTGRAYVEQFGIWK